MIKKIFIIIVFLLLICGTSTADNYIINSDTVYIDDSKVYLSATPHTLSSSGWVYFNLTLKVYTGNIDACWGFNTSVSKPTKAEVYSPHWVNTTTNHKKTFYNFTFYVYTDNDLDYGNSYNTNYRYTITESIVNENGTTYITSNAAFDSYTSDGTNYTVYWYTRHDNHYLWKDFSSSFNSVIRDYNGFNKWYYIKNIPIMSNEKYTVRAWVDVPVSTKKQSGKYYFAIKPSGETISQAVNNGHFYNLDPWWNATWSKRKNITLTGNTSGAQSFSNPTEDGDVYQSTKRSTEGYIFVGKFLSDVYRGYSEWNISTIPPDAIITKAIFKYSGCSNAEDCIIKSINIQPSISSPSNIYAAVGDGDIYADITGFPEIGNNKQIVLNDNATSDIQSAISIDWFAVGFINKDENNLVSEIYSEDHPTATPNPTLYVEYTSVSEGGNNQTDYQLLLNITYEPEMQPDFNDLRFCNETHELDAWLESKVDSSYALVWVEFPTIPTNTVEQTYYMYYGNVGAASDWDGNTTFVMFDDFSAETPEPLTLYDESGTDLVIDRTTDERFEFTNVRREETEYVYESIPSISDFAMEAKIRLTGQEDNVYGPAYYGFGDSIGDLKTVSNGLYFRIVKPDKLFIFHTTDGVACCGGTSSAVIALNTDYYATFTRVGTAVTINIYLDAARTTHITGSPQTYTDITPVAFDKVYIFSGYDINHAYNWISGWNDDIRVRKYVANPPTYAFGSEEHYIPEGPTTLIEETGLIMSEITSGLKGVNISNYLVYAFILIGILLIILGIQIITKNIYRG